MFKWRFWRTASQLLFVGFFVFAGIRHQVIGGGPSGAPPIDSFCVFGGVETFFTWLTTGTFLAKTASSNLILLGALLLSVFLAGSAFCGWVCPFGAIQEWLGKAGRKVFGRQISLPHKLDRLLQYLKYPVLIAIIALTILEKQLWFETYDPFKVLFHFNFETSTAYWVLFIFLGLALLIERFWCKYLCPVAAIINPLSKLSLLKFSRDQSLCANCSSCTTTCSLHKTEPGVQGVFTDSCTVCLECVDRCKTKHALGLRFGPRWLGPGRKSLVPLTVLLVFAMVVSLTLALGVWNSKVTLGEVQYDSQGQVSQDDLKGWMTLNDLSERYHKPVSEVLQGLKWDPDTDLNTPLKDLAKNYGSDMESLKPQLQQLLNSKPGNPPAE